ncbi:MAG: hypothetical protein CMG71_03715 [Candidatus Marinimicrobia bacterium]|mgnify:CR=1 FL=1|nr:hypothetical protein [Candidatus Neomarinimicrobiota bacterium]|tara:strand:- start:16695 stop:20105 length:3411 start_codon:yes stop_codon:yes gene_type:complete
MKVSEALRQFRLQKLRNDLACLFWAGTSSALAVLLILLSVESIFWLSPAVRYGMWWITLLTAVGVVLAAGAVVVQVKRQRIRRYSLEKCATEVGAAAFPRRDDVINAVQLEQSLQDDRNSSASLTRQFIEQISSRLFSLSPTEVLKNGRVKQLRQITVIISVLIMIVTLSFLPEFMASARHWIHPGTSFDPPHPFRIVNLTGDIYMMGGDSTSFTFEVEGEAPDSIVLELKSVEGETHIRLGSNEQGYFKYDMGEVFQNLEYRALVQADHFWERWKEISSATHSIAVIDRPTIENFSVTITPPEYTGLGKNVQEGNVAEIRGLVGSTVDVALTSDNDIARGFLNTFSRENEEKSKVNLDVRSNRAEGQLTIIDELFFTSHIFNYRKIGNLDPIKYRILPIQDAFPSIEVLMPASVTELGSDFSIPVQLHIQDDFGFSHLQIAYEMERPEYVGATNRVSVRAIPTISNEITSQDVFYIWDLSALDLMPEDEVQFHFELYDNDQVSGPKKSLSKEFTARFPSLADLFARTEEGEEMLEEDLSKILQGLEEINRSIEDTELKLLKAESLEWEDRQAVQKSVDEVKNKLEEVKLLQDAINDIMEQAGKHNLFSNDLMEKFKRLNELLQDVITPEMVESMAELQDSMDEMTADQLMKALKDFQQNTESMEVQIDRFIDIFRRIRAEQKLDELSVRLTNLSDQQEELADQISQGNVSENGGRLLSQQERNSEELARLADLMEETAEAMAPYAQMPSGELEMLAQSSTMEEVSDEMNKSERALNRGDLSGATNPAASAAAGSEILEQEVAIIAEKFSSETAVAMAERFEKILRNTLFISKEQEQLRLDTSDLSRNSPRLGQMASRQQMLRDQLSQLISILMSLSRETFAVTPELGKAIGSATVGMNESLTRLEERRGPESARQQGEIVKALNEAAVATLAAMEQIRQSGSASGFEQFLERMRQMAQSQEGINVQTFQLALGQMAAVSQEQLMQRLRNDQSQLKKSLDELIREMKGSGQGGDRLDGIAGEMEEVIRNFERRQVSRRTVELQQRILTRMLDAQKSLKQQDMSEKRRAITAGDFKHEGPDGLPSDLGQRRNLAIEALNRAMKGGYPRDYQAMIRRYFNSLAESEDLIDENTDENRQ